MPGGILSTYLFLWGGDEWEIWLPGSWTDEARTEPETLRGFGAATLHEKAKHMPIYSSFHMNYCMETIASNIGRQFFNIPISWRRRSSSWLGCRQGRMLPQGKVRRGLAGWTDCHKCWWKRSGFCIGIRRWTWDHSPVQTKTKQGEKPFEVALNGLQISWPKIIRGILTTKW